MVPTFRWGLFRSNFCLAICPPSSPLLRALHRGDDLARDRLRRFLVTVELHRESGATPAGVDRVGGSRRAPLQGVLNRHRAGDLEGHLARVDVVIRPVDELDAD